jgi:hypothetical protein
VTYERIREAIIEYGKDTENGGALRELAGFADVLTTISSPTADIAPLRYDELDEITEQGVANLAFMIVNSINEEVKERALADLKMVVHYIPWVLMSDMSCFIRKALIKVPRTPLGRKFGKDGNAYKPHEIKARWEAFRDGLGSAEVFGDCAQVSMMAYPEWYASRSLRATKMGRMPKPMMPAAIANLVYLVGHVAIRELATALAAMLHDVLHTAGGRRDCPAGPSPATEPAIGSATEPANVLDSDLVD